MSADGGGEPGGRAARVDWFDNDELFRAELETGHHMAMIVGGRLEAAGVTCRVNPMKVRENIEEREAWADEADVDVFCSDNKHVLEVKSRDLSFGERADSFPYGRPFVDTVSGWSQKQRRPIVVVLVSQQTHAMLVIPVAWMAEGEWRIEHRWDRRRKIRDRWYTAPRERLRPMSNFIDWIRKHQQSARCDLRPGNLSNVQ